MRRREFITLLGGAAAAWPLAARAQQAAMPVIGYLSGWSTGDAPEYLAYFRRGLAETGYTEGRNVVFEFRFAEGHFERVPELVADLVRRRVSVIAIPNTTASAVAAKAATQTIPIVFSLGSNPVEVGLVQSLSHPGGNVTGLTALQTAVTAQALGMNLLILNASNQSEIDAAFATLIREQAGALLTNSESLFMVHSDHLAALTARHRVPALYAYRENVTAGGLMSYGANFLTAARELGLYAGSRSQRREAGRPAGAASNQNRTRHQLEDR